MSLAGVGLGAVTIQALGWTLVHFLWQGALACQAIC